MTAPMDAKLLPCPFCGYTRVEIQKRSIAGFSYESVRCVDCLVQANKTTWQKRTPPAAPSAEVDLLTISAINSMIGYCQSLKAGTVITQGYMDRINDYYIPALHRVKACACPMPDVGEVGMMIMKLIEAKLNDWDGFGKVGLKRAMNNAERACGLASYINQAIRPYLAKFNVRESKRDTTNAILENMDCEFVHDVIEAVILSLKQQNPAVKFDE